MTYTAKDCGMLKEAVISIKKEKIEIPSVVLHEKKMELIDHLFYILKLLQYHRCYSR